MSARMYFFTRNFRRYARRSDDACADTVACDSRLRATMFHLTRITVCGWLVRVLPAALLCSTVVRAQETPNLGQGARVLAIVSRTPQALDSLRCESRVMRATPDTLLLSGVGTCPYGTYNGSVSALRVDHGSRWKHLAVGLASGAAAGGIVARLAAGDGCVSAGCDDGGLAVALMTIGGITIGGVSGLLIGAVLPAGAEWGTAQPVRVIRVGSLTLQPDIRISLRPRASR